MEDTVEIAAGLLLGFLFAGGSTVEDGIESWCRCLPVESVLDRRKRSRGTDGMADFLHLSAIATQVFRHRKLTLLKVLIVEFLLNAIDRHRHLRGVLHRQAPVVVLAGVIDITANPADERTAQVVQAVLHLTDACIAGIAADGLLAPSHLLRLGCICVEQAQIDLGAEGQRSILLLQSLQVCKVILHQIQIHQQRGLARTALPRATRSSAGWLHLVVLRSRQRCHRMCRRS